MVNLNKIKGYKVDHYWLGRIGSLIFCGLEGSVKLSPCFSLARSVFHIRVFLSVFVFAASLARQTSSWSLGKKSHFEQTFEMKKVFFVMKKRHWLL